MPHPTTVPGYDKSLTELACAVARLRYAELEVFVAGLAGELEKQASADQARGRIQLSSAIEVACASLRRAQAFIQAAWRIAAPYELGRRPDPKS